VWHLYESTIRRHVTLTVDNYQFVYPVTVVFTSVSIRVAQPF
jgi:hypothetical protein